MLPKILSAILILLALYMGVRQGWAMLTGKPDMLELFGKWNIGRSGVAIEPPFFLLSWVILSLHHPLTNQ
jgi:hypothetical protein